MNKLLKGAAWGIGGLLLVVAALAAAPFFFPLDRFIPQLTSLASEKIGQPVSIGALNLRLLPTPRAVASAISVGRRHEVTVGELEIVPDLFSLVSGPKTVRLVKAEDVRVKEAALGFPAKMPKSAGGEEVLVKRVELRKVKLEHSSIKLPEFDLTAELAEGFALDLAKLETSDHRLRVVVDPDLRGTSKVTLEAVDWTLPAGVPVRFEWLTAEGTLKGENLDLPKIEGKLYGGKLRASAKASWARQWQVSGKGEVEGVDVVPLQRVMGQKPQLTGRLKAESVFSARARTPAQLSDALVADGPFEVLGGAYQRYDLSKISLKKLEEGGSTKFDEMRGEVQVRGQAIAVNNLCVRSPSLVAAGHVAVAADDKLSGKLDVSIAKTGGFVGIPVAVSGTTADPSFMPSKGYVIGAAIGTVILPGLGTSIGSSIGNRIEGKSSCK